MAEVMQMIKFEHIMKRIICILLVGGLLCLGSCNNKQVSQKKDAQELAGKSNNKELNEILKQFESYVKNKDKKTLTNNTKIVSDFRNSLYRNIMKRI